MVAGWHPAHVHPLERHREPSGHRLRRRRAGGGDRPRLSRLHLRCDRPVLTRWPAGHRPLRSGDRDDLAAGFLRRCRPAARDRRSLHRAPGSASRCPDDTSRRRRILAGRGRRRRAVSHGYNRPHGPPRDPDPRRRHRSGAGGGDASRPRRDRRRVRVGDRRRRRGRHRRVRNAAPGSRPRLDPPQPGRAQGPDHDAGRGRLPERERDAPPGARPVREPAAGPQRSRASRPATRTSTS